MSLKTNRDEVDTTIRENGQQVDYLVLSDEEIAKGFVRPLRQRYRHVGAAGPIHPARDLTDDEKARYTVDDGPAAFVKFEMYPPEFPKTGRYWTRAELAKIGRGCGSVTSMGYQLSATYAAKPHFYGGTFCVQCGTHFPVGERGEFVWVNDDDSDGPRVGT